MGTEVYAQPSDIKQVAGVMRLGNHKLPPQKPLTDADVYGSGAARTLTDADVYGAAPQTGPNPFDQFDEPKASPNPFDRFDQPEVGGNEHPSLAQSAGYIAHRGLDAALTLPGLPADLAVAAGNYISGQFGGPQAADTGPLGSQAIHGAAKEFLGYDAPREPASELERWGGNIAGFVGAGAGVGGLTRSAIRSAVGGAAGLTVAQEAAPDSTLLQAAASLAGGHAPQLSTIGGQIVRGALRGGAANARSMADNLAAFDRVAQTAGQPVRVNPGQLAPGYNIMQGADALIARSPGGQPGVLNANVSQSQGAARAVDSVARRPSANLPAQRLPTPTTAGSAVQTGFDNFVNQFMARARQVEQALEQRIGTQTRAPITNTQRALVDLQTKAQSDPAIQRLIQDPYVRQLTDAVSAASSGLVNAAGVQIARASSTPAISFGALRALRSDVGELISKSSLSPSIKEGQLKHLYGALTEDLTAAADQAGVGAAWRRYNQWYAAGQRRIEGTLQRVVRGREQAPEAVFDAVMRLDSTQAYQAMRSLNPQQRATVAAQALRELGQTRAAGAVAEGADYSYSQFIRNLTDMRQRGTFDAVFGSPELRPIRNLLSDLETTSEAAMRANKVAHDVSAAAAIRTGSMLTTVGSLATGNYGLGAALFASAWVLPAGAGRLFRSRPFLTWLSRTKTLPPENWPAWVARLHYIAQQEKDPETRKAYANYLHALPLAQQAIMREQRGASAVGGPNNWQFQINAQSGRRN